MQVAGWNPGQLNHMCVCELCKTLSTAYLAKSPSLAHLCYTNTNPLILCKLQTSSHETTMSLSAMQPMGDCQGPAALGTVDSLGCGRVSGHVQTGDWLGQLAQQPGCRWQSHLAM